MHNTFEAVSTRTEPLGVRFEQDGLHVAAVCNAKSKQDDAKEFGIVLYDKKHPGGVRVAFPKDAHVGAVYAMLIKGYQEKDCRYLFFDGDELFQDPYAKAVEKNIHYGKSRPELLKCKVADAAYDWQGDKPLRIPYEDSIIYALHVRGFTKHASSGVKQKGTFAGVTEKTAYLKELGVTSLLLMPAYEFDEMFIADRRTSKPVGESGSANALLNTMTMEQAAASYKEPLPGTAAEQESAKRINYWGYQSGLYRIPKGAYAYGKDAVTEFKDMVKAFHQNGIEVMMQFYFPPEIRTTEILDIIKFWVLEYHVDGFHVMGVDMPVEMLSKEPLLADTKILTEQRYTPALEEGARKNVGWMNEGFLYDMRRLVKGDDNMINNLLYHIRLNPRENGVVNYIAKWDGMRLRDMVSYDRKHNEANGENNQDGTDYNCSWNCGVEGKSRKKAIMELRMQQMKNAIAFVIMAQGTPLLYSGDEFGNTQDGNNNPYCQDNATAWVKWNDTEKGRELLDYTKKLIRLRMRHPILHSKTPLTGIDSRSCGYPDISFHGREAWRPDTSPASRSIGIMYCGLEDAFFYIGINMYWEPCVLGLPQLPKGKAWVSLTENEMQDKEIKPSRVEDTEVKQEIHVPPRSILLYTVENLPVAEQPAPKNLKNRKTEITGRKGKKKA